MSKHRGALRHELQTMLAQSFVAFYVLSLDPQRFIESGPPPLLQPTGGLRCGERTVHRPREVRAGRACCDELVGRRGQVRD